MAELADYDSKKDVWFSQFVQATKVWVSSLADCVSLVVVILDLQSLHKMPKCEMEGLSWKLLLNNWVQEQVNSGNWDGVEDMDTNSLSYLLIFWLCDLEVTTLSA
jgi:hypothetical protein